MTIADPTPHEKEALVVVNELISGGFWTTAWILRNRVTSAGINDDATLREALAFICRTPEQIGESIRRVHAEIESASAPATGEGW